DELIQDAKEINGIKIIFNVSDKAEDSKEMRMTLDSLKDKLKESNKQGIILMIDKAYKVLCFTSDKLIKSGKITARDIINILRDKFGGSGGGRSNMVQGALKTNEPLNKIQEFAEIEIERILG
ncbi:DHH family phosphoesterase, partial [bacterium]